MYKAVLEGLQCRDLTSAAAQADTLDAYLLRGDIYSPSELAKEKIRSIIFMQTAFAADSLFVRKPQIPILIDRTDNILVEMRVQAHKGDVLNKLSLQFKEGIDLNDIKALRFFYSGTEATSRQGKHYRPVSYISSHAEGKTKAANPAYSIKQSEVTDIANVVTFTSNQPMVEGVNYYWISIEMKPEASLLTTFTVQMPMAEINNMPATIVWDGKSDVRRMGIGVRHAGDDVWPAFCSARLPVSSRRA